MFLSMNTIPDIEKLYVSLGERDYEAVMSHLGERHRLDRGRQFAVCGPKPLPRDS